MGEHLSGRFAHDAFFTAWYEKSQRHHIGNSAESMARTRERTTAIIIFATLALAYAFVYPRWLDWNANARIDLSAAIVERGTLSIDAYAQNTGDYALFKGHRYIDKAPGLSFLGVPVYYVVSHLTRPEVVQNFIAKIGRAPAAAATINRPIDQVTREELIFAGRVALTTWIIVGFSSAALGVILFNFLGRLNYPARWRALAVLIYGMATPAFTYSAAFYGHQVAAVLLFGAFAWLQALRSRPARPIEWLIIGGLLGYAVITEYPAALIAAFIGLYAIWIARRVLPVILIVMGSLIPIGLWGTYNTVIFGTPFALGYQYTADPRWSAILSIGLLSANVPTPEAIWGLTLSPFRGLFFVSPILLLTIPGLVLLRRSVFRAEWITTLSIVLGFFVLVSASAQWWGGWSAGPRYLVPLLPFLVWPLTAIFDWMAHLTSGWRVGAWLITIGLVVVSIVNVWSLTLGGQYYAPDDIMNPLIEYSWPHVMAGDVARNWGMIFGLHGAASILPLLLLVCGATGLIWIVTRPAAQKEAV
jgi:hypothetical protein